MEQAKQYMKQDQLYFLQIIQDLQTTQKQKEKATSKINTAKNKYSGKIPQLESKIKSIKQSIEMKDKQFKINEMKLQNYKKQKQKIQQKLVKLKENDSSGLVQAYNDCSQLSKKLKQKEKQVYEQIKEGRKQIQKYKKQIKLATKNINQLKQKHKHQMQQFDKLLNYQKHLLQSCHQQKVNKYNQNVDKIQKKLTPLTDPQRIQLISKNIKIIKNNRRFIELMKQISSMIQQIGLIVKKNIQKNELISKHKHYTYKLQKINQQLKRYSQYQQLLLTLKQWQQIEDHSLYLTIGQQIQKSMHISLKFEQKQPKQKNNKPNNPLSTLTLQQRDLLYQQYINKAKNTNQQQTKLFLSRCSKNYSLQRLLQQISYLRNSQTINYRTFLEKIQKYQKQCKKLPNYYSEQTKNIALFIEFCNLANFIPTKHTLKISQIVAFYQLINTFNKTNKFCQIKTGEGKTVIVSMIAAFQSFKGKHVDIITSNQVLANDGVQFRKKFYNILGLTVSNNNRSQQIKQNGLRQCYGMDIVYGTISNFQFDWLNHHCNLANTFGQRHNDGHQIVIIDEVDSLVLDRAGDCAKLSDQILGMQDLRFLFIRIWIELCRCEQEYQKYDSNIQTKEEYIKNKLMISKDRFLYQYPLVPDFYCFYRQNNYKKWIKYAIDAKYHIHQNEDYIIQQTESGQPTIIPLDRQIGCTLDRTIWTHLHPFVQIKHKLQITTHAFVTTFISNWGYIMEYNRMYGVTGTLGSKQQQNIIKDLYNSETSKIPPLFQSKIFDHGKYFYKYGTHYLKIAEKALQQSQRRPVLIISQTVKDLFVIKDYIQEELYKMQKDVELYVYQNQRDQQQIQNLNKEGMKRNQILLATNIGGRGTDLKINDLALQEGGLFQITTYLPQNIRIQLQAAGRAARNGEPGESILIACLQNEILNQLKLETVPYEISQKIETELYQQIQQIRDKKQTDRLKSEKRKIESIKEQKFYFQRFLSYLKILVYFKTNRSIIMDIKTRWGLLFDQWSQSRSNYDKNQLQNLFPFLDELCYNLPSMIKHYTFINPYFALKYAESLLSEDQKGIQSEMPEIEKNMYLAELLQNRKYIQNPFSQLIYNGILFKKIELLFKNRNEGNLQKMVLNVLKQFMGQNKPNDGNTNNSIKVKITEEQINSTLKALNTKINYLCQLVRNQRLIHFQWNTNEQNHLIKHLECQIFVFKIEKQNINKLLQTFRQNPEQHTYIYKKEKYTSTTILQHYSKQNHQSNKLNKTTGLLSSLISSLEEECISSEIYIEQLDILDACGGGMYIEISKIFQLSIHDPRIIRGVQYVGLGLISNLVGLLLPGLGQFITAAASGTFIKKGMDCIICAIFNEEPDEQEQIIDMIADITLIGLTGGLGSFTVIVSSCLKSFAKRFLQEKIIAELQKKLDQGLIETIKAYIKKLIMPICKQICLVRTKIYQMIRSESLRPVSDFLEQKIYDFEKWFYQYAYNENKLSEKIPMNIIDEIVQNFNKVEQKIRDIMMFISQKMNFIKKTFYFIKTLPNVISSLLKRLYLQKINFSKINSSNLIILIQIIQQFTKGDLINEIQNIINNFQQIFTTLNNFQSIIDSIKSKMDSLFVEIDKFINIITQLQLDQNCIQRCCIKIKQIFILKLSQKINCFLLNNPFQILLRKQGYNLDNPQILASNIASTIWGFILGTLKVLIFKKVKVMQQKDIRILHNTCGFDSIASLLHITDINTIEKATGIIQGPRGITLEEMKILLNKIGLISINLVNVQGNYALTINNYFRNQLIRNHSKGAIAAVRSNDQEKVGHMYAVSVSNYFDHLQFIDREDGIEKICNQDIWVQRQGTLMIPFGFCEEKRKEICQNLKKMKNQYSFTTGQLKQYLLSDLFGSSDNVQKSPFYPSHPECKIHISNKPFYKKILFAFKKHLGNYTFEIETIKQKEKNGQKTTQQVISPKIQFMIGVVGLVYKQKNQTKKKYFITHSGIELLVDKKIKSQNKKGIKTQRLSKRQYKHFRIDQNIDKYDSQLRNLSIQFVHSKLPFDKYDYNVFGEKINLTNDKIKEIAKCDIYYHSIQCRTCAAQKALNRVGQFMHNLKQSDVDTQLMRLEMYETYYIQPGITNSKNNYSVSEPAKSCKQCQAILPIITMKQSTYLQFQKRKTNGKEWNKLTPNQRKNK